MAANLVFKFLANDKGLKDGINRSKKDLHSLGSVTKSVSATMKRTLGAIGLSVGFAAGIRSLVSAGQAAANDARSQRLLALQMRTTTKATDDQIASNEKFIGTLSNQVGIVDDDLRPAFAALLRGTGKIKDAQKLLKIALDGSAASGRPLAAVSQALVRAQNGQLTSLYKLAPQLKKTKGGIDEYAASVAGAAAAAADPFTKVKVTFDNLNEQIGYALMPMFEKLSNWFIDNGPKIEGFLNDLFDPTTGMGAGFAETGNQLTAVVDKLGEFFALFDANGKDGMVGFFNVLNAALYLTNQLLKSIVITAKLVKEGLFFVPNLVFGKIDELRKAKAAKNTLMGQKFAGKNTTPNVTININKPTVSGSEIVKTIEKWQAATKQQLLAGPTQ
jgi:hypothetical protein